MKQKIGRKLLSFLLTLAMVIGLMPGMGLTAEAATIQYDDYLVEVTNHNQNFIAAGICDQTTGLKCKTLSVETARALENYLKSKTGSKVAVIYGCTVRSEHPGWSRISFVIDGTTDDRYYMDASIANAISNRGARNEAEYKLFYVKTDAPDFETANETVTFKVINGQWDDGTTEDVTVSLSGLKDEIRLAADQIPAVGTKPNDTYKAGSWDVTPSADTAITAATTYTYTYAAKEASVATKAPEAKTLTSNGTPQPLVTAGTVEGGTLYYALGSNSTTAPADGWSTEVPTATEAGTYYVWYKVVGDANHNDVDPACVVVTIGEAAAPVAPAPTTDYTLLASLKTSGKKALKMRWTAVPGAEGYDVFFGMCNKGDCQLLASVNGTSYKIKGLKKGFAYKGYVWAWKNVGGAKTYIGEPSPDVHAITNGKSNHYTNPKKISVKKKKLTVGVGKRKAIKAKLKKFSDSRNYLNHVSAKIRYYSSDRTVATVDAKGRVTGVGPGKCTVFAVAENGLRVGVKVTVK